MTDLGPEYFAADAEDRRCALAEATRLAVAEHQRAPWPHRDDWGSKWIQLADDAYRWLRNRPSIRPVAIVLIPGPITKETEHTVTTSINLQDDQEVNFTLGGLDDKDAPVPAPTDTWAWTLNDPDASGASVAVSADTTNATVSCGTPTANLSLSVAGASTGFTGAEAIIVNAGPATAVSLIPGTPSQEPGV